MFKRSGSKDVWNPYVFSSYTSISGNGAVVALQTSTGAKVFHISTDDTWVQLGETISNAGGATGQIALSSNGQFLAAISAALGMIRVYQYNLKQQKMATRGVRYSVRF
jgi:hypothetical protein